MSKKPQRVPPVPLPSPRRTRNSETTPLAPNSSDRSTNGRAHSNDTSPTAKSPLLASPSHQSNNYMSHCVDEESVCNIDDEIDAASTYSETIAANSHLLPNSRTIPHMRNTPSESIPFAQKLTYYIPCYNWISEYQTSYLLHDIMAGLTLASYQIPLSMSFATALAHVPTASGLLGLSIGPIVYMFMGSVPQMIVGPEAAVSMIIGQTIEKVVKHNPDFDSVDILCVMTFISGIILFVFGILRFGFLDNVLCGTLLRGFITAIGLSMILNSIISILGLNPLLSKLPKDVHVHSAIEKLLFLINNYSSYHKLTALIGGTSFFILIFLGMIKRKLVNKNYRSASFFPEILFVIVLFTIFSYVFDFKGKEIEVIGRVTLSDFKFRNPLSTHNRTLYSQLFPVSFVCAILGFFETSTAGKSLSSMLEMPVSSNRELVSLGTVGTTVSFFGALPSFGGYARSKLNATIGARSPVSGCVMGLTTLFITFRCLNYIYYLPLCVLNAVIATVGYKMIQETPKELKFHIRTKGWNEIVTFFVTLAASLYYSIEIGVAMGCFYSLMRVLKHSTQSRVQILARVAGTDTFVNPEFDDTPSTQFFKFPKKLVVPGYKEFRRQSMIGERDETVNISDSQNVSDVSMNRDQNVSIDVFPQLEDREGCLVVKIAEPLTFFNANDMKGRLKRIELYRSTREHPGSKQKINQVLKHIVFDLHGMTSIDSSASQIMYDIVDHYQKRGVNVFFTRLFKSSHLIERLRNAGIEKLLSIVDGEEFGIKQTIRPYYDDILDALKAIDRIDSTCDWETRSYFSTIDAAI